MDIALTTNKWENIPFDCLCIIFSKLGLDDLIASVPFVSKSWYQASSQPILYQILDFHLLDFSTSSLFSKFLSSEFYGFMKLAMSRSQGTALELRFSSFFPPSKEILSFTSITCPKLKNLCLLYISFDFDDGVHFLNMINKWRDLERLEMRSKPSNWREVAEQIGIHCPNFYELKILGLIDMNDVFGIVNFIPMIKVLDLSGSPIRKKEVLAILDGCKALKRLSLKKCIGFVVDQELKKRAKYIEFFEFEGCRIEGQYTNSIHQINDMKRLFMCHGECFEMGMI